MFSCATWARTSPHTCARAHGTVLTSPGTRSSWPDPVGCPWGSYHRTDSPHVPGVWSPAAESASTGSCCRAQNQNSTKALRVAQLIYVFFDSLWCWSPAWLIFNSVFLLFFVRLICASVTTRTYFPPVTFGFLMSVTAGRWVTLR